MRTGGVGGRDVDHKDVRKHSRALHTGAEVGRRILGFLVLAQVYGQHLHGGFGDCLYASSLTPWRGSMHSDLENCMQSCVGNTPSRSRPHFSSLLSPFLVPAL